MPEIEQIALLDTTIQLDRWKGKYRRGCAEDLLRGFDFTVTTGISLLEFKATLLAQCLIIYNNLRLKGQFTLVRDALCEKNHPQVKLRSHIFNNIINVQAVSSFEITTEVDRLLAEKVHLQLRRIIPRLYKWFVEKSADSIQLSEIDCTRAREAPRFKRVAFATNLPKCRRGENKYCHIEDFVRQHAGPIVQQIRAECQDSEQLVHACELIEEIVEDLGRDDLSHNQCRNLGDCLIALEGRTATHFLSTNKREWQPLCQVLGKQFVQITYPEEATR